MPALAECRDYRMQLPRPKIGKACIDGFMSVGGLACEAICNGADSLPEMLTTVNDVCRKFIKDYPKPTVHKSCKHGGTRGWALGLEGAREKYSRNGVDENPPPEPERELKAPPPKEAAAGVNPPPPAEEPASEKEDTGPRLLASLPVTVDDEEVYLKIFEGMDAEAEIAAFCKDWMSDSFDSCIKQLTPHVEKKLAAALAA